MNHIQQIPFEEGKDKELRCQHPYLDGLECGHDYSWKLYWIDGEVRCEEHIYDPNFVNGG